MKNVLKFVGDWVHVLDPVFSDKEVTGNLNFINSAYSGGFPRIYPDQENVFRAFQECPYRDLRVVIVLQDPYHDGSATGIATANFPERPALSPSLKIIKDTVSREIYKGQEFDFDPTLIKWERQGILMLNTALTVEEGLPLSHQYLWQKFTTLLLRRLSDINSGIIYCLWGKHAERFTGCILPFSNTILTCTHPVYASYRRSTWECSHFRQINMILKANNNITINW